MQLFDKSATPSELFPLLRDLYGARSVAIQPKQFQEIFNDFFSQAIVTSCGLLTTLVSDDNSRKSHKALTNYYIAYTNSLMRPYFFPYRPLPMLLSWIHLKEAHDELIANSNAEIISLIQSFSTKITTIYLKKDIR